MLLRLSEGGHGKQDPIAVNGIASVKIDFKLHSSFGISLNNTINWGNEVVNKIDGKANLNVEFCKDSCELFKTPRYNIMN